MKKPPGTMKKLQSSKVSMIYFCPRIQYCFLLRGFKLDATEGPIRQRKRLIKCKTRIASKYIKEEPDNERRGKNICYWILNFEILKNNLFCRDVFASKIVFWYGYEVSFVSNRGIYQWRWETSWDNKSFFYCSDGRTKWRISDEFKVSLLHWRRISRSIYGKKIEKNNEENV